MIFVDSNIPMYLVGAAHPNKAAARLLLERAVADNEPLATDVEVLQELLHRYTAINRRDAIGPSWDALVGVVDVIHGIDLDDVSRARRLVVTAAGVSARDALHVAVMQRHRIDRILTFDTGFDGIVGIERIRPWTTADLGQPKVDLEDAEAVRRALGEPS